MCFDIPLSKVVYFTLTKNVLLVVSIQKGSRISMTREDLRSGTGTETAFTVNLFSHQRIRVINAFRVQVLLSLLVDLSVVVRKHTSNGNNFSSKRECYCKERSSLICLTVWFVRKQESKTG